MPGKRITIREPCATDELLRWLTALAETHAELEDMPVREVWRLIWKIAQDREGGW